MADKTAALIQTVDRLVAELATSLDEATLTTRIDRYAALCARFHRYSAANLWLIHAQLAARGREPQDVAGFRTWLDLGRCPRKGTGLAILAPATVTLKDETTGDEQRRLAGFRVVYVFDVADTYVLEGHEDKYQAAQLPWQHVAGDHSALYTRLLACATRAHLTVELGPGPARRRGLSTGAGTIWLNDAYPIGDRCQTLLHELAHELCHDRARRKGYATDPGVRRALECEAEAISHCLAHLLGLPYDDAPQYLALYRVTPQLLRRSLDAIRDGVATITAALGDPGERRAARGERNEPQSGQAAACTTDAAD